MRSTHFGRGSLILVLFAAAAAAQTPTVPPTFTPPKGTPIPTATPLPRLYLAEPTVVNTLTTNNQRRPAVAIGSDGKALIVWNSDTSLAGFYDIKGQLYDAHDVKDGTEFVVAAAPAGHSLYTPDVGTDGLGRFVVVWSDFDGNPSTNAEVWVARFDHAGAPVGSAAQVNTYTAGRQRLPQVAVADDGKFVVAWGSEGQDGSGLGVFARRFDAAGAPDGGEFAVNSDTTGDQDRPAIDIDPDGAGFTIAFNNGSSGIAAREFGPSGPLNAQFPVLGAGHQLPHLGRLDGTANTLFVAENVVTGDIDGIRSVHGAPQTPFPIAPSRGNPFIGARLTTFRRDPSQAGPVDTSYLAYEEFDSGTVGYASFGRQVDLLPQVKEVGAPFLLFPRNDLRGVVRVAAADGGRLAGTRAADTDRDGDQSAVEYNFGGQPRAVAVEIGGDDVISPGLGASFGLELTNTGPEDIDLAGTLTFGFLTGFSAPNALTIDDNSADYGTIHVGETGSCQTTGNCYGVTATGTRPATHWDETVVETMNTGVHKAWLLHVGNSFADVPETNLFYPFIENLLHNGVTGGGACGGYCPTDGVKRQQMAVFLLKARFGSTFTPPPATGTVFTDVSASNPFAAWIEALFLLGVTGGCSGGPPPAPTQFCPDAVVNRQQMAVFLLKTLEGSAYTPPAAAGIFTDVPLSNPFVAFVEELYARQVTGGCVASPLQYCPANPTNRQQMAAFLVKTFSLALYGP